jgi:hypothetical protein
MGDPARKLIAFLPVLPVAVFVAFCLGSTVYMDYRIPIWLYSCIAAVCAVFPLLFVRKQSRTARAAALAIYLLAVAYAWVDAGHTRRPFLNDLFSIKPGMSVADVRSRMGKWTVIPVTGEIRGGGGALHYRHCDSSAYGADIGSVTFSHGRVTKVEFSPD